VNLKAAIIFCSFILLSGAPAYCGQASRFELTDGSVIKGEVVSYENNVYTVNTANLDQIKIEAGNISKIEPLNYTSTGININPAIQTVSPAQLQPSVNGNILMQNPENMGVIMELTNSPELQRIARDPEVLEAAQKNDIQALMKNKEFMDIVNSPEIQEAVKKLKK